MFIEPVPIFGAVTGGLSANYLIDFGVDLNHTIPLRAMWQGSPVECRTLYIDNYTNSVPFRVTNGNSSQLVPQYAVGTVDISGFDDVTLTSEGAAKVNVSLLSHAPSKYGFDIRGALPASLTNDPYWTNVTFLCHFNALTTSTTFLNTKTGNYDFTLSNYPNNTLSTTNPIFNETSLNITLNDSNNDSITLTAIPSTTGFTTEVAYRPSGAFTNSYMILTYVSSGASFSYIIAIKTDGAGLMTHLSVGSYNGGFTMTDVPYSFSNNTTYFIAVDFVSNGRALLYVNGINIGDVSAAVNVGAPTVNMKLASHGGMAGASSAVGYYDELRTTNYKRYTGVRYDVQTSPFLDQ